MNYKAYLGTILLTVLLTNITCIGIAFFEYMINEYITQWFSLSYGVLGFILFLLYLNFFKELLGGKK